MSNPNQNEAFVRDKRSFFSSISSADTATIKIQNAEQRASLMGYSFLITNHQNLETEFAAMFTVLQKNDDEKKEVFWLYCYYCASLLETFYKAYGQTAKEEDFKKKKEQIKSRLNNDPQKVQPEEQFITHLKDSFVKAFRNLQEIPYHIAQIRDNVAFINLCRLYWAFCRMTLTSGLLLARDLHLIEKLDHILGTHTDVDKIISVFQAPIPVINYLSVGFFAFRIMVEGGLLLKHTFFPSKLEKGEGVGATTAYERFKFELYKRQFNFANDFVWSVVNFLTNLNHLSHVPSPITGYITAGFLVFDVALLIYRSHIAKQEYLSKAAQYRQDLDDYSNHKKFPLLSDTQRLIHTTMLNKQLQELDIEYRAKNSGLYFAASAAALLAMGFTAAIILTNPVLIFASFFACTVAVAMYLSTDSFTKFEKKRLYLQDAELTHHNIPATLKEFAAARNDFIFTMVKNTVMPMILITTFAICWPAAIVLTVMYAGYEIYHAHGQHADAQAAKKLAFTPSLFIGQNDASTAEGEGSPRALSMTPA